ncbi:MAG: M24 family metallopeptidase [Nitrospinota bacterium]
MSDDHYPRFSDDEMNRRHALARGLMDSEGLDALLLYGFGGTNRSAQANMFWLSAYRDFNQAYLIFPKGGDASLFVGLYNHLHNAKVQAIFSDVRHGAYGNPEKMADQLDALAIGAGRIGLVGINPRFKNLIPFEHMDYLKERFPEADWMDVSAKFRDLRIVKSAEEIEWIREGARLSDLTMTACEEFARPGIPEIELAGRMAAAFRVEGGEQQTHFVTATPMVDPHTPLPWQNPRQRKLEAGDILLTEISAAYFGYAGQVLRPFTVAADPTPPYRALFDAAMACFEGVAKAMKAGAPVGDILDAVDVIPRRGFKIYDSIAHGFGVDLVQPSIGIRGSGYAAPPADFCYEENMVMVIQPNPMDDAGRGLQIGDLGIVTPDGFESLHTYPMAFPRCG